MLLAVCNPVMVESMQLFITAIDNKYLWVWHVQIASKRNNGNHGFSWISYELWSSSTFSLTHWGCQIHQKHAGQGFVHPPDPSEQLGCFHIPSVAYIFPCHSASWVHFWSRDSKGLREFWKKMHGQVKNHSLKDVSSKPSSPLSILKSEKTQWSTRRYMWLLSSSTPAMWNMWNMWNMWHLAPKKRYRDVQWWVFHSNSLIIESHPS